MAIRQKKVIQGRMEGEVVSAERTTVSIRDVKVDLDEPIERGGTNTGLTPTETAVAALVGCTNVIGHRTAKANGVQISDLKISAVYTFDRHGVLLESETRLPFPKIELSIVMTTAADDASIEKMKADLAKFCPISILFRAAGTEIVENWTIVRP